MSVMDNIVIESVEELVEEMAEAAHNAWWTEKLARGVTEWPNEKGVEQLVPYAELDEEIREFDRIVVRAIVKTFWLIEGEV